PSPDYIPGPEVPPSPDYIPGPEVPPSPDYIPGPEVPPSPDYIHGPEGPPSPDYVPGPEEPEQAPPSPIYVPFIPEPVYPEFLPEDDVLPVKEQLLPVAASPTTESPGYIPEFDPEEDPEEDDEEDPEEDPADYPADRGDDRDDEEPSDDDDDDDDDDDAEEEHLAPADPAAVAYLADQDPYLAYRVTARMSIRPQAPAPFLSEEVAERLLALPTPPPSPLSPYSSPLPQIPSPPLPIPSPPPNSPTYVEGSLGSRAAGIRQRDALPSPVHETEMPEICLPLRKRPCRTTPGPGYEVGESSAAGTARRVGPTTARADLYGFADTLEAAPGRPMSRELGYGIRDTWDDLVGAIQEIAPTTLEGVNQRVIELSSTVDEEDEIIYSQLDDARYDRALLRARVNTLESDSPFHRRTYYFDYGYDPAIRDCPSYGQADQRRQTVIFRALLNHRLSEQEAVSRYPEIGAATVLHPEWPDSHTSGTGARRNERTVRECTYQDFMKCQPKFFQVENQVKFATCTLNRNALRGELHMLGQMPNDVAYADDVELWNLKVQGTDVVAYNQRFQELALLSDRMFPERTDKIERYVGGMPDPIYSSVGEHRKPKTMQGRLLNGNMGLMERRINTLAERQTENKRRLEDTPRNNQTYQQNKRQNTGRAYAAGNGDRKPYEGTKPRCPKPLQSNCPSGRPRIREMVTSSSAYAVGVARAKPRQQTLYGSEEDHLEDCLKLIWTFTNPNPMPFGLNQLITAVASKSMKSIRKIILEAVVEERGVYSKFSKCEILASQSTVPPVTDCNKGIPLDPANSETVKIGHLPRHQRRYLSF
ncbi:hypothetical protein Tco_0499199, partial [Tanacetum coccineum]